MNSELSVIKPQKFKKLTTADKMTYVNESASIIFNQKIVPVVPKDVLAEFAKTKQGRIVRTINGISFAAPLVAGIAFWVAWLMHDGFNSMLLGGSLVFPALTTARSSLQKRGSTLTSSRFARFLTRKFFGEKYSEIRLLVENRNALDQLTFDKENECRTENQRKLRILADSIIDEFNAKSDFQEMHFSHHGILIRIREERREELIALTLNENTAKQISSTD